MHCGYSSQGVNPSCIAVKCSCSCNYSSYKSIRNYIHMYNSSILRNITCKSNYARNQLHIYSTSFSNHDYNFNNNTTSCFLSFTSSVPHMPVDVHLSVPETMQNSEINVDALFLEHGPISVTDLTKMFNKRCSR